MKGNKNEPPVIFTGKLPTLREAERMLVVEVMGRCRGNTALASEILGISRGDLAARLERYRLEQASFLGKKTWAILGFSKNAYINVSDIDRKECCNGETGPAQDEDGE